MSSVSFLVSAVLTVCVLHAFDQAGDHASIDKLDFDAQAMISKPEKARVELSKPSQVQTSAQNVNVYGIKKSNDLLPVTQNATKNIALKDSKAI